MREAHGRAEAEAFARIGLGGEGEEAAGRERARGPGDDLGEIADIGQNVGGDDEVEFASIAARKDIDDVADFERVVTARIPALWRSSPARDRRR